MCFNVLMYKQQMQCGVWFREHDFSGGNIEALQSLPPPKLGGLQLQKDLSSHLCKITGIFMYIVVYVLPPSQMKHTPCLKSVRAFSKKGYASFGKMGFCRDWMH